MDEGSLPVMSNENEKGPVVSIVVPLFNEEANVSLLYDQILAAMLPSAKRFEMIFVDDGSGDSTFRNISAIAAVDERVKIIRFRRNFGQTPAMAAGIEHSSGPIIITMDGDLQNDPADIPMMLEGIDDGADLVIGWRHLREDRIVTRKIPSMIANRLIAWVTGVPVKDNGCSLKAYRSDIIKRVPLYSEMHRFIPAMSSMAGARIIEVKVRHHPRRHGVSKYGLSRIYKVLLDLLTIQTVRRFAARPMYWFFLLAFPFLSVTCALSAYSAWIAIAPGYDSLVVVSGLALAFGATAGFIITCGVLAELIYATGTERPVEYWRLTARNHPTGIADV